MTTAAQRFSTEGFGPDNLPYASFSPADGKPRLGVRLGNLAISLPDLIAGVTAAAGPELPVAAGDAASGENLDPLLAAGHTAWQPLRTWLQEVMTTPGLEGIVQGAASPVHEVTLHMPFTVADYVDYYASEHHASNIGRMFRPDQEPLLPNWKHLPVGYHGRAGTVIPSGTDVPRPKGLRPEQSGTPSFGPSRRLDIEAELGFVVGGSAPEGEVSVARAGAEHLFGVALFNDWSARDIQGFEYVPLGPYLGKSFASSISLWVVPFDALAEGFVEYVGSPDIVGLEEIQDDSGESDDGVVDAGLTLDRLVDAIATAGGPAYEWRQVSPEDKQDGGVPGGNIRNAFLFNPDRARFVDVEGGDATTDVEVVEGENGAELSVSPGRISPEDEAWEESR